MPVSWFLVIYYGDQRANAPVLGGVVKKNFSEVIHVNFPNLGKQIVIIGN